jgi:SAM-dependent methyltransferase
MTAANVVRVLDAGCGTSIHVPLPDGAYVVGIDISPEQLEQNAYLDERILGDLQTHSFEPERFDLIVCWDTLEHLPRPDLALENLARALAPGGRFIIAGPDVLSVKGVVTKWTPHFVHRWAYRRFLPFSTQDPFPTYLRLSMRPSAIRRWASVAGLTVESLELYEAAMQRRARESLKLTGWRWTALSFLVRLLSLGLVSASHTDFRLVLAKPERRVRAGHAA